MAECECSSPSALSSKKNSRIYFIQISLLFLVQILLIIPEVAARGRMVEPAQRSSLWTIGFESPINDDDSGLNCGGPWIQHGVNRGRCGVCGDRFDVTPRDNEPGGLYANGIIANTYSTNDSSIPVMIDIQSFQGGFFEFRICPNNNVYKSVSQECLDRHQLRVWDLVNKQPGYRFYPTEASPQQLYVELPRGMTCTQCVLQWKWHTAKDWGRCQDGTSKKGCGPQEEFYNCADIAIEPATDYNVNLNQADIPLPTEGPRPTIELGRNTLNFEVGFKPYGQNLRHDLNVPISFLPAEIVNARNIGPVVPNVNMYDATAQSSLIEPTIVPSAPASATESKVSSLDVTPTDTFVNTDTNIQSALVNEINVNVDDTLPASIPPQQISKDVNPLLDTISNSSPVDTLIDPTVSSMAVIPSETPMVAPDIIQKQSVEAMLQVEPALASSDLNVYPSVQPSVASMIDNIVSSQMNAGTNMPPTVPRKTGGVTNDAVASTVNASPFTKQRDQAPAVETKPQDAGGIAIPNLGFNSDINVRVGLGAVTNAAEQTMPTKDVGTNIPNTGKQTASIQDLETNIHNTGEQAASIQDLGTNIHNTGEQTASIQDLGTNIHNTGEQTASIQDLGTNIHNTGEQTASIQDLGTNIHNTGEQTASIQDLGINPIDLGTVLSRGISGVDPTQVASMSMPLPDINSLPAMDPRVNVPTMAMDLLNSLKAMTQPKPELLIRRRRQAGMPPPPPGSAGPPPPPGPAADTGPIHFGNLIGDSFGGGNSQTMKSFINPADFSSGQATGVDMTGEALIEPGVVNAPSAIGRGAASKGRRFDPGPQNTMFEPMFIDNTLPGPTSMLAMADAAMQPVNDAVPYMNPGIPRPPKQSAAELEAAISQAPMISSAISDTGKTLDPSALVGASYIPELNEGRSNQAETSTAARHSSMVIKDEMQGRPKGRTEEYLSPTRGTSIVDNRYNLRAEIKSAKGQFGYRPTVEEILSGEAGKFHHTQSIDSTNQEATGPSPTDTASMVPIILNNFIGGGANKPTDNSLDPAVRRNQEIRQELIRKLGLAIGVIGNSKLGATSEPAAAATAPVSDPTISALLSLTAGGQSISLIGSETKTQPANINLEVKGIDGQLKKDLQTKTKPITDVASDITKPSVIPTQGVAIDFNAAQGQGIVSGGPQTSQESFPRDMSMEQGIMQIGSSGLSNPATEQISVVSKVGNRESTSLASETGTVAESGASTNPSAADLLSAVGGTGGLSGLPGISIEEIMTILNMGQPKQEIAKPVTTISKSKETVTPVRAPDMITDSKSKPNSGMSSESFGMESAMFDQTPIGTGSSKQQVIDMSSLGRAGNGILNEMGSRSSGKTILKSNVDQIIKDHPNKFKQLMMGNNDIGPSSLVIQGLKGSKFQKSNANRYTTNNIKPPMTTVLAEMATTGSVAVERIDKGKKPGLKQGSTKQAGAGSAQSKDTMTGSTETLTAAEIEALLNAQNLGLLGQQPGLDQTSGTLDMGNQMMFGLLGMSPDLMDPALIDMLFGPGNQADQSGGNGKMGQSATDKQAEAKLDAIAKTMSEGGKPTQTKATDPAPEQLLNTPSSKSQSSGSGKASQAKKTTPQMVDNTIDLVLQNSSSNTQVDIAQEGTISLADLLTNTFGFGSPAESLAVLSQETGYETRPKAPTSDIKEVAINPAGQSSGIGQNPKIDFTPLGEMGAGSSYESMLDPGTGQEELIWDPSHQTWVPASGSVMNANVPSLPQKKEKKPSTTVPVPTTGVGLFDTTAAPFDFFGMQTTSLMDMSSGGRVNQKQTNEVYTEKSSMSVQTVDPKPSKATAAVESMVKTTEAPIVTTTQTTTTKRPTMPTIDPLVAEQRRRLQQELDRQKAELQKLQQQKREQERQLMLEKQRIEYEQRQLLLKQQQLEIERQKKAQLEEQMLLEKKKRELAEKKEALRLQKLQEEQLARQRQQELEKKRQAELQKAREAELLKQKEAERLKQLEIQKQMELQKQQEAELAKKKELEALARAKDAAAVQSMAETTKAVIPTTTTKPLVTKESKPVAPEKTQSFTPLGAVGGTESNVSPDAATLAAWQTYLQTLQAESGASFGTQSAVKNVPAANQQQMIYPPGVAVPKQVPVQLGPQGVTMVPTTKVPVMTYPNLIQQVPIVQAVPGLPQTIQGGPMQFVPGTFPFGQALPGGSGILGAWSGRLKQAVKTPAPTTTTTTTTTPAPTPAPKPKIPIRPDLRTQEEVKQMFVADIRKGINPNITLMGLTPEKLMKAGINPRIVNSGDFDMIAQAVQRTLNIPLLNPPAIGTTAIEKPKQRKKTPLERAIERRQMMMEQRMMNDMLHALGLAPEPLEPGDPGYRGQGATAGRGAGGLAGRQMMGGRRRGAAQPFEMTDAQQIALENQINRQRGLGRGGGMNPMMGGGVGSGLGGRMGGGLGGGMGGTMGGGVGGAMGGGMAGVGGAGGQNLQAQLEMLGL